MKNNSLVKFLVVILFVALLPELTLAWVPQPLKMPDDGFSVALRLELPAYEIVRDEDGLDTILVEGFDLSGLPGTPVLPRQVYRVALPPHASLGSLGLKVTDARVVTLSGAYRLKLAAADLPSGGAGGDGGASPPGFFSAPEAEAVDFVRLLPPGQMRKWRFARLEFTPFRYDAASGELRVARQLTVQIDAGASVAAQDVARLQDSAMDDVARQLFVNYDEAQAWYRAGDRQDSPGTIYDYVIVTTNAIKANSASLASFIAHKQGQGYSPLIITEDAYGGLSGQSPDGTAEKIRKWLQDNYVAYGIEYVLLIGDPDPDDPGDPADPVGDVPMKMCWPRRGASDGHEESPTDYFFADLTGNWDLDGDQYFGEWEDDTGDGGVDLTNEVYVGRIPVYDADYAALDGILEKIIDYENEVKPQSWRKSVLLPISFLRTDYDGAPLAEQMQDDYLTTAGFSSWTQYQQGGEPNCQLDSAYASDQELRGGTVVRDHWAANNYGLVVWWGHGLQNSALVGCDPNCWDGTLFSSSYAAYLDDGHPSFVYQNAHMNGYPEDANNLQYALLKQGGIVTVGATRVSWFNPGIGYGAFDGSTTNSGIGYEYAGRLVQNQAAGDALYNAKASMNPASNSRLMNFYNFNLYGDPSVKILTTPTLPPAAPANLKATAISQTRIDLSWVDNSDNENGFKIERSPNGTAGWTQIDTVGANVTGYSDVGLTCNTAYSYRVRAYNTSGDSEYGNVAGVTTVVCVPAAPGGLVATAISQTRIDLSWVDNSDDESGFKIERSPNGNSGWKKIATVGENVTAYSDTGLLGGTTYYYRVRAYNAGGDSGYDSVAEATTPPYLLFLPAVLRDG